MKRYFLIVVMVFTIGAVCAIQPVRKPFIQIKIDGKAFKNGEILTVLPGQKLVIGVELEGGRRDFCKFPETYAEITSTAQILSRGENGLTYQVNGLKAEWKLLDEDISFIPDEFVKVNSQQNLSSAEIGISNAKFSQSFVKIILKTTWQFSQNEKTIQEENLAEGIVYFKVAGSSDVWFSSLNIEVSGIKNDQVQEKLIDVQSACDSIEKNFYRLNFTAIQQAIRDLQNSVNFLKSTIDEVKVSNPSYQTKILFIGLPSDHPYSDINILSTVMSSWISLEALVNDLKQQLGKLPGQPTKESKDELVKMISLYVEWQSKLPENTLQHLPVYIPEFQADDIEIPEIIHSIAETKSVANYSQSIIDFNAFLDQRIDQIPNELQKINFIHTRLQAIRLFDGMLMSYFSSINWAEWKNTRE